MFSASVKQDVAMFWDFVSAVSLQQQSAGDHVQTAARSNHLRQKQRQQAGQEINEMFTGDQEKFSGAQLEQPCFSVQGCRRP